MIAVDTTLLVYANREESALHEAASSIRRHPCSTRWIRWSLCSTTLLTEDRDFARFQSVKPLTLEAFLER